MYNSVAEELDEVAERVLKIGYRPYARQEDYLRNAEIAEAESKAVSDAELVNELGRDYRVLADRLREVIKVAQKHGDEGTADDAIAFLKDKEKQVWMLTAFLS